jgi:hypothetical protein
MPLARVSTRLLFASALLCGCAKTPPARQTGFLSDYSNLEPVTDKRMVYTSPAARGYHAFIVTPVEFRLPPQQLNPEKRAEVARHFQRRLGEVIEKQGFEVVEEPGVDVALIRVALTDVAASTWWQKIHPVSRAAGAGTGGAAMEGEVVDSVTGRQLAAVVQAAPGNQFDITAFTTVQDVNSAIDKWADQFAKRLRELRFQPAGTGPG